VPILFLYVMAISKYYSLCFARVCSIFKIIILKHVRISRCWEKVQNFFEHNFHTVLS
jgi:hypothetical protein